MVIQNGFTYIAFLMCIAGVMLGLEKYTKWKVFQLIPPLVFIYVLNMIFCTLGLYSSDGISAAYKVLKNNLLYAMIFVMLLRCDFRKLSKLGGRLVAVFLACSATLFVGFLLGRCRSPLCVLGGRQRQHGGNAGSPARRCRCLQLRTCAGYGLLLSLDCSSALRCTLCCSLE